MTVIFFLPLTFNNDNYNYESEYEFEGLTMEDSKFETTDNENLLNDFQWSGIGTISRNEHEYTRTDCSNSMKILKVKIKQIMVAFSGSSASQQWPETSKYKCHWCTFNFETVPIFLPIKYNESTRVFTVKNNFCSFNCAMAYNNCIHDSNSKKITAEFLNHLFFKIFGNSIPIKPAPSRELLQDFGGILSIEEYRKSFSMPTKEYSIIYPPIVSCIPLMQIEEYTESVNNSIPPANFNKKNLLNKTTKKMVQRTLF